MGFVDIVTGVFGFVFTLFGWILWLLIGLPFKILGLLLGNLFTIFGPSIFSVIIVIVLIGIILTVIVVGSIYLFKTQYCKLPAVIKENELLQNLATRLGVTCDTIPNTPVIDTAGGIVNTVTNAVADLTRDTSTDVESADMGAATLDFTGFHGCPEGQVARLTKCRQCPAGYIINATGTKCHVDPNAPVPQASPPQPAATIDMVRVGDKSLRYAISGGCPDGQYGKPLGGCWACPAGYTKGTGYTCNRENFADAEGFSPMDM